MNNQKFSIAMLTNLFHPVATGSATQTQGLARTLSELGHNIVIITPHLDPKSPKHEVIDGFEVYRIPTLRLPKMSIALNFPWLSWTFWPANLRRIESILKSHDIDILHIHNHMFDMAFSGVMMKSRLNIPVVLTIHTVIKHSICAFNFFLYPADRFFLRHTVVRRVNAVICPDENIKDYLHEAFSRNDGSIIPYGISLPAHPGSGVEQEIVTRFSLKGRRIILSLGHVHALRNRLDLIRAMAEIRTKFPEVLLLIVGDIADQRPVNLVKELALEDNVVFTGKQPYAHVPAYHALAELESMWLDQAEQGKNSPGVACMEAMLFGKPVLTMSNVDTFGKGVLVSGHNIVILRSGESQELANIIMDLLDHPDKTKSIGIMAKSLATEKFTWSKVAAQTLEVYSSLIHDAHSSQSKLLDNQ
jgi:glycosyltransferase involved in cell wall biosynthesis